MNGWLKKLEDRGYIRRERVYDNDGKRKIGWMIYIVPLKEAENIKKEEKGINDT